MKKIMMITLATIFGIFFVYNVFFLQNTPQIEEKSKENPKNQIVFSSNDKHYLIGDEIKFSITALTFQCEQTFDVQIFNYDHSELLWNESIKPECQKHGEMFASTANLPQNTPITILSEGEYVVFVELLSLPLRLSDRFLIVDGEFGK